MLLTVCLLDAFLEPWFSQGGKAWFKLGATLVGTCVLGVVAALGGACLSTGGK